MQLQTDFAMSSQNFHFKTLPIGLTGLDDGLDGKI